MDSIQPIQPIRPITPTSPKRRLSHSIGGLGSPISCVSVEFDAKCSPMNKLSTPNGQLSMFEELYPKPLEVSSAILNSPSAKRSKKTFDKYSILSNTTKLLTDDDINATTPNINKSQIDHIRIPTVSIVDQSTLETSKHAIVKQKKHPSSIKRSKQKQKAKRNKAKNKPNQESSQSNPSNPSNPSNTTNDVNDNNIIHDNNNDNSHPPHVPMEIFTNTNQTETNDSKNNNSSSQAGIQTEAKSENNSCSIKQNQQQQQQQQHAQTPNQSPMHRERRYSIPTRKPLSLSFSSLQLTDENNTNSNNDVEFHDEIMNGYQPKIQPKRKRKKKKKINRSKTADNNIRQQQNTNTQNIHDSDDFYRPAPQKTENGVLIALGKPILIPYLNGKWHDMLPNLFPPTTPRPPSPKSLSFRKDSIFHPKQHKYTKHQFFSQRDSRRNSINKHIIAIPTSFAHNRANRHYNSAANLKNPRLASQTPGPNIHKSKSSVDLTLKSQTACSFKTTSLRNRNLQHNTLLSGNYGQQQSFQEVKDILSQLSQKRRRNKHKN